ncbi:ArdC family protein [Phytohabitans suffuscus]|uniref:ArdC family protein n=1 Tax=Phytohabitans suffuscus TaxID=624315 RepID=UPI0038CD7818
MEPEDSRVDPDDFAQMRPSRSFNNTLLIWSQHLAAFEQGRVPEPMPSYVAGYKQWQSLDRQVAKGQPGYMRAGSRQRLRRMRCRGGGWAGSRSRSRTRSCAPVSPARAPPMCGMCRRRPAIRCPSGLGRCC